MAPKNRISRVTTTPANKQQTDGSRDNKIPEGSNYKRPFEARQLTNIEREAIHGILLKLQQGKFSGKRTFKGSAPHRIYMPKHK